jgi:arylformamidase
MLPATFSLMEQASTISIKPAELVPYNIKSGERILFKTKNSSWAYDSGKFVTGTVYVTKESASFLIDKKVRLVGIDYITIGGEDREENRIVHKSFLESGVSLLEEINLAGAKAGKYELVAVPLRLRQGDAGPCRAIIRPILKQLSWGK